MSPSVCRKARRLDRRRDDPHLDPVAVAGAADLLDRLAALDRVGDDRQQAVRATHLARRPLGSPRRPRRTRPAARSSGGGVNAVREAVLIAVAGDVLQLLLGDLKPLRLALAGLGQRLLGGVLAVRRAHRRRSRAASSAAAVSSSRGLPRRPAVPRRAPPGRHAAPPRGPQPRRRSPPDGRAASRPGRRLDAEGEQGGGAHGIPLQLRNGTVRGVLRGRLDRLAGERFFLIDGMVSATRLTHRQSRLSWLRRRRAGVLPCSSSSGLRSPSSWRRCRAARGFGRRGLCPTACRRGYWPSGRWWSCGRPFRLARAGPFLVDDASGDFLGPFLGAALFLLALFDLFVLAVPFAAFLDSAWRHRASFPPRCH